MSTPSADPLAEQGRLVAGLCRPQAFAHAVRDISVVETHISFVILTGDFAYKIKKAVDLGFVDYSTLARRRFCCEEEVRLNRRLAEALYLGVVGIGGSIDAPHLASAEPAIEYAVRMVEFPQDCLLDRVLAAGGLTVGHLDALLVRLADFHRHAAVAGPGDTYGTAAAIGAPVRENFAQIDARLVDAGERTRMQAIEAWSRAAFENLQAAFAERRAGGRIRECHGDLHLGNMLLLGDHVEVFDGIEFNPNLRWIDVISEMAFFIMDLGERGRPDYAHRVLNGYLEASGDFDGLRVLRFYLVYRAMVRAKVTLIRAAEAGLPETTRARAIATARAYTDFATRTIAPKPVALIITHGVSGSGKTVVTQELLEAIGAIRVRSDVERKRLHDLPPLATSASPPDGGLYREAATAATYERLAGLADGIVAAGFPAIVDATFLRAEQRERFRRLAAERQVPFVIVACQAPHELLRARVGQRQRRGDDASEAGLAVLERQLAAEMALSPAEAAFAVTVDTSAPETRAAGIAAVLRRLSS